MKFEKLKSGNVRM